MNRGLRKILLLHFIAAFLFCNCETLCAQTNMGAQAYKLEVHTKDTVKQIPLKIPASFATLKLAYDFINNLPSAMAEKGYPAASVDSVWVQAATIHILLYSGTKYNWVQLVPKNIDKPALTKAGFSTKDFTGKAVNIKEIESIKERLISYYENAGFPFAAVYLDSISISEGRINALLVADRHELYHIDSIHNAGKLKLNKTFLQRYLSISNGSLYSKEKLADVDVRMSELAFAEVQHPSSLNMLGSGAVLNVYADQRHSSTVSAIIGFLPDANNTGKFQFTGDVNLDLKNVFNGGEGLLIKFQSLQPKSPRLNLGYDKPYIFRSPFGLSFLFDMFKKDSAFLNLNAQAGLTLNLSRYQTGKVFVQWQTTNLLQGGFDTNEVRSKKRLPQVIDVDAVNAGVTYAFTKTDYLFNPRTGNEFSVTASSGIKNIRKNADILNLKTSGFNYASLYDSVKLKSYQLRIKTTATHYLPLAKAATLKLSLNAGVFASPDIFRNEVFQIGGYRLLRGFDEESIYATQYGVLTTEYRYLVRRNSYLFGFVDLGFTKTKYRDVSAHNQFTGAGGGILYETKAGLLNLAIAIGKRDDVPFNLRGAAKIHFGYINYF